MTKTGKIAISATVGFIVALTGLWFFLLKAPEPQAICEHKIQLALQEMDPQGASAQALIAQLKSRCVVEKQHILQLRGKVFYARHAKCVMQASEFATADRC